MADRVEPASDPSEVRDWYLEDGRVVFTEAYHRKRGYCCGSGCRHCPYDADTRREAAAEGCAG